MGIFSRIGEIINANINAMLEKAENPEKMVRLMINEMEDTLIEIKSSTAEVLAERARLKRAHEQLKSQQDDWAAKAELAMERDREDLARGALERKLHFQSKVQEAAKQLFSLDDLVAQYQNDILKLEEKLANARQRQKYLTAARRSALQRKRVEDKIYQANTQTFSRFEEMEAKVDLMEAEADLQNRVNAHLNKALEALEQDSEIEAELQKLKSKTVGRVNQKGTSGD